MVKIDVNKIIAVEDSTQAGVKRKPENFRLAVIQTLISVMLLQFSNQLSWEANWEPVIITSFVNYCKQGMACMSRDVCRYLVCHYSGHFLFYAVEGLSFFLFWVE